MVSCGSPCYIINLDMKKAFDKLWRDGLFCKLIDKIDNIYWRAIVNYYANSSGKVKINGELSTDFKISDGAKQGGGVYCLLFYLTFISMICWKNASKLI